MLKDITGFEWDEGNREKNFLRHKVSNTECEEIFKNIPLYIYPDKSHSTSAEKRFLALGQTTVKRKLFISFTVRKNKIRIISARDMSAKERKKYIDEES